MRSLLGLSIGLALVAVAGCSNSCPAADFCSLPHPDYCPCLVDDASVPRPDAFIEPVDAAADDAGSEDGGLEDGGLEDGGSLDAGTDAT